MITFMKPSRIVIVGCGYVGRALGEVLHREGHHVIGTTTSPDRLDELRQSGITPCVLDIADRDQLRQVLSDCDGVYLTLAPKKSGVDYRSIYLEAQESLLSVLPSTTIRRIIYTSSTRVYGQDDGSWVDEDSPTEPQDEKGQVLLEVEKRLLGAASDSVRGDSVGSDPCSVSILRLSGIVGPRRDPADRIRKLAGTCRHDGNQFINLIHRDDIVAVLHKILEISHTGVLNLSDGKPIQRRELYDRVLKEAGLAAIDWTITSSPSRGKRINSDRIQALLKLPLMPATRAIGRPV